ncbi:MAG TPA: DsbA family protein [Stellaceae bacterium]|nr:DsbA family protein [Stellaceae bacterium]
MRLALLAGLAAALFAMPALAADPPLTPEQSTAVEKIVHDYLLSHPEVLTEAITHAEEDAKAKDAAATVKAIAAHKEELERDPSTPVLGNPDGDVTLVEFFDYRCPYCKATAPALLQLLQEDPKVRLVLKDIPILGADSVYASRVGLVAARHGKAKEFWQAMFALKDKATPDSTLKIAKSIGLDPAVVKKEMESPEIDAIIKRNTDLAVALGIDATPTFVIGTTSLPGAITLDDLRAQVAAARKRPA